MQQPPKHVRAESAEQVWRENAPSTRMNAIRAVSADLFSQRRLVPAALPAADLTAILSTNAATLLGLTLQS